MIEQENLEHRDQMERVGILFDPELLKNARDSCWKGIQKIREKMVPGISEADGRAIAIEVFRALGSDRFWHAPQVRFDENTLMPFGVPSKPGVILNTESIFFLDFGPVFRDHEADCGAAFYLGNDPEKIKICKDVQWIHASTAEHWRQTGAVGKKLYDHMRSLTESLGWVLNLKAADGHRIGDFPHAIHHKGALIDFEGKPSSERWILETQIRHPTREFGAFYEDLLF